MSQVITRMNRRAFLGSVGVSLGASVTGAFGANVGSGRTNDRLTFLTIGDWGRDGASGQREVAEAMERVARGSRPRFVVTVGDNFYPRGVSSIDDSHWQSSFESVYEDPSLKCPWYAVLGNHDVKGDVAAEIEYTRRDPRWRMPSRFYRVAEALPDGGDAEFFFIDTDLIAYEKSKVGAAGRQQLVWLEDGLAESRATWKFVIGHHPVFSGGAHGSNQTLIKVLKPLLDQYHVVAYLNGHDHDLQHILVDGVNYLTCGAGAKVRPSESIEGTRFVASTLGFMVAEVSGAATKIAFVGVTAQPLYTATIFPRTRSG